MSDPSPEIAELLARNRAWVQSAATADPGVFPRLAAGQSPRFLWIGCSDSRVPAEAVTGLGPGEMFVHRNIANAASPRDPSVQAVLQYAVQVLKVRHILVVGHYGCGGVNAALHGAPAGPVDRWLEPIRVLAGEHEADLAALPEAERANRLSELNVWLQVQNIAANPFVREAWADGAELAVHGWCYALATGLITDLGATVAEPPSPLVGEGRGTCEAWQG